MRANSVAEHSKEEVLRVIIRFRASMLAIMQNILQGEGVYVYE